MLQNEPHESPVPPLPANIHAAIAGATIGGAPVTSLIPRIALQLLFIALVWWSGIYAPGRRSVQNGADARVP